MEFNLFSTAAALIAAAALTWLVLRFFFGAQKATSGAMDAPASARPQQSPSKVATPLPW